MSSKETVISLKQNENERSNLKEIENLTELSDEENTLNNTVAEFDKDEETVTSNSNENKKECLPSLPSQSNADSGSSISKKSCKKGKKRKGCGKKSGVKKDVNTTDSSSSSDSSTDDDSSHLSSDDEDWVKRGSAEMERKRNHPDRLHPELWYNDPGQVIYFFKSDLSIHHTNYYSIFIYFFLYLYLMKVANAQHLSF